MKKGPAAVVVVSIPSLLVKKEHSGPRLHSGSGLEGPRQGKAILGDQLNRLREGGLDRIVIIAGIVIVSCVVIVSGRIIVIA